MEIKGLKQDTMTKHIKLEKT